MGDSDRAESPAGPQDGGNDSTVVEPAMRRRTPLETPALSPSEAPTQVDDAPPHKPPHRGSSRPGPGSAPTLEPKTSLSTLAIGEIIGEGGMGVVREATQLSLARVVAVKSPHEGASEADALRMLREAWVTGFLEHPGIVPIYDIAKGRTGPVVVMRRIEGDTWHACMTDEKWAMERGARDLLEENLRVFVRVCEIVEFAHSKGVIHRDIKPANVMIGGFGEIYLLDWGLALALGGEAAKHLAPSASTREIAGTMSYAAPEMVDLVDAPLSEKTDVYLFGALLFEIATGSRPHSKGSDAETIASIDESPPPVPDHVSPRLAAIMRRAMQRLPRDRYGAVTQLRLDVLELLRSRDSEHLARSAEQSLSRLREACASDAPARVVHELHAECRFAFREALRTWPENTDAQRGLVAAETAVIEREVKRDPLRAATLLDEIDGIDPALASRVRSAAKARREEDARLAQLARDADGNIGRRARRIALIVLGLGWSVTLPLNEHYGPVTNARYAAGGFIQLVVVAVVCLFARDLTKSLYNRRIIAALVVVCLGQGALFATAAAFQLPVAVGRTLQIGLWAIAAALLAVFHERRLWPMAVACAAGFTIAVIDPSLRSIAAGFAAVAITANLAMISREQRLRSESS